MPQKPRRVKRAHYRDDKNFYQKTIFRIILFILFILLAQSIFQIKYFKHETVKLSGHKDLNIEEVQNFINQELAASKWFFFQKNNYFLIPVDELATKLESKYNLEEAKINKKWPDVLEIAVKEKSSHFIWQKDDSLYLLDAKGRLNRQISVLDDKYLLLDDQRDYRPSGEEIFTPDEIDVINQIYVNWMDLIASKAKLTKISIYSNWDLELHTETGFYVKIDKDQSILEQLNNLRSVLEENIAGVDIDYIDVRFGDKVYFK